MTDLLAGRAQMALSLGFHIVFAAIGMAMPFFMATAHFLWLRTGEPSYLALTKAWSRGVAIFFAVGAVSGTALSFELGLLWPAFMGHAGAIIGLPFSWEGTAFFLEAVFLGLFLYGWERVPRWAHWGAGLLVGVCGVASAAFVVCANSWMNAPTGFDWVNGHAEHVDPLRAMFNDRAADMGLHMILAAFVATGFGVAGVHAWQLLRHPQHPLHRRALPLALAIAAVFALCQPLSGDLTAKTAARLQPLKLAAAEGLFETTACAPLTLGGLPDAEARTLRHGLAVPCLLSVLAFGDPHAPVQGLVAFPRDLWPPLTVVHLAYQAMIGLGSFLALVGAASLYVLWRRGALLARRPVLRLLALLSPCGFLALEAGWTVTEVGRQPWIIYGILRTADALTPMPGVIYEAALYAALYLLLGLTAAWLMVRQITAVNAGGGAAEAPAHG